MPLSCFAWSKCFGFHKFLTISSYNFGPFFLTDLLWLRRPPRSHTPLQLLQQIFFWTEVTAFWWTLQCLDLIHLGSLSTWMTLSSSHLMSGQKFNLWDALVAHLVEREPRVLAVEAWVRFQPEALCCMCPHSLSLSPCPIKGKTIQTFGSWENNQQNWWPSQPHGKHYTL